MTGTSATRLLTSYRQRLAHLLERASAAGAAKAPDLRLEIAALVEGLNDDLLALYRLAESGTLLAVDLTVVLPALERLRDTLRQRGTRVRPVRDTLGKAVAGLASAGSAPSDSTGAASSS